MSRLTLKIDNFNDSAPRYGTRKEFSRRMVESFLDLLSTPTILEVLSLDFDAVKNKQAIGSRLTRKFRDRFLRGFTATGSKTLELSSAWIDGAVLNALLGRHQTLRELNLYQVVLSTSSWLDVFGHINRSLPELWSLDLILLSEGNPDTAFGRRYMIFAQRQAEPDG